MGNLVSKLFGDDPRLEACLLQDSAHVTPGSGGDHVVKIQYALLVLETGGIAGSELEQRIYGPETARLVKAFKSKRNIINPAYQQTADDIVGRMTIRALDAEFAAYEATQPLARRARGE